MEIQPIFTGVVPPMAKPRAPPYRYRSRVTPPLCRPSSLSSRDAVESKSARSTPCRPSRAAVAPLASGRRQHGVTPPRPIRPAAGPTRALPTGSYIVWRAEKSVAEVSVSEGGQRGLLLAPLLEQAHALAAAVGAPQVAAAARVVAAVVGPVVAVAAAPDARPPVYIEIRRPSADSYTGSAISFQKQ